MSEQDKQDKEKLNKEFQQKINTKIDELSKALDFKEYFKVSRDIFNTFVGTWKYVDELLEKNPFDQYKLLLKSFGNKAALDKKEGKVAKEKLEVIEKFAQQINQTLDKKDYTLASQQLFYVLLGNVLEHLGKSNVDMKKFDLQKDLYPDLKYPLGLVFFMFQSLTFGSISQKINLLSNEYLNKYSALLLTIWRTTFEMMHYEKYMEEMKNADKAQMPADNSDKK